jgi:hypothetical protein
MNATVLGFAFLSCLVLSRFTEAKKHLVRRLDSFGSEQSRAHGGAPQKAAAAADGRGFRDGPQAAASASGHAGNVVV